MKTKDIAHAIHISQKTVKRRIDIMLFNRVIDFTIFVNPMEVKGYINVGVFIEIGKEGREKAIGEIYEEIKNLLVLESPYQGLNTIGLNLYVENMWEIERVQNKAESMKAVRNVSIVLPLRRRYSHEQLQKEIDKRITKALS